jgi:hypothetical protein
VGVGVSVAGWVAVGGTVTVGVCVRVGISVGVKAVGFVARNAKNTTAATAIRMTARIPSAAGRLNLISGIRLAWIDFSAFLTTFASGRVPSSVPQTRQRVAFSPNRVPQVGQTFVFCEEVSGFIRWKIIPLKEGALFFGNSAFGALDVQRFLLQPTLPAGLCVSSIIPCIHRLSHNLLNSFVNITSKNHDLGLVNYVLLCNFCADIKKTGKTFSR